MFPGCSQGVGAGLLGPPAASVGHPLGCRGSGDPGQLFPALQASCRQQSLPPLR